jgi:hypothetical protein
MEKELQLALLEGIWLMRWNKKKTAMSAVLTVEEAQQMCKDIVEELNNAGYEIVKKKVKDIRVPVVGDQLKAKHDYLDLFQKDETYEIYLKENNLGDDMFYLFEINSGKKISDWGLKLYEINLHFNFLN